MPSIRKRPRSVLNIAETTAPKLLLDSPYRICVFTREQRAPLPLQATGQLACRDHVSESQRRNRSLVDDEQHEDDDGGPGKRRLGTCTGAICTDAQHLGAT